MSDIQRDETLGRIKGELSYIGGILLCLLLSTCIDGSNLNKRMERATVALEKIAAAPAPGLTTTPAPTTTTAPPPLTPEAAK